MISRLLLNSNLVIRRQVLTLAAAACLTVFAAPTPADDLDRLVLPPGFSISLYSDDVRNARQMALGGSNTVFVGTVNGGIWRTLNANVANPSWQPLTDDASSLSIGSSAASWPTAARRCGRWRSREL